MPNHCENQLSVTGPEKEIERFCRAVMPEPEGDEHPALSFGKLIPMPKQLSGITSGGCTINGKSVHEWREVDGKSVAVTVREQRELRRKYGATNWYDWNIQNWGTKWDAYGDNTVTRHPGGAEFRFTTAWGPPEAFLRTAAERFPKLTFRNIWEEEGGGRGDDTYKADDLTEINEQIEMRNKTREKFRKQLTKSVAAIKKPAVKKEPALETRVNRKIKKVAKALKKMASKRRHAK